MTATSGDGLQRSHFAQFDLAQQPFAEALVDSWMKSPGHRKNILHGEVEYLGCACELPRNADAMQTFYCTQVFFLPLAKSQGVAEE